MVDEKLRKKFKKTLIDRNLSLSEFANSIGISRVYLSEVLNGKIENFRVELLIDEYTRTETR